MKIPSDASPAVQAAFKEIALAVERLQGQFAPLNGARLIGAPDAVTKDGLVTLRQLQVVNDRITSVVNSLNNTIEILKQKNNLV